MRKLIVLLLTAVMFISPAVAADGDNAPVQAAPVNTSSKANYYVVEVTAEWCVPCQKMRTDVFPHAKVKEALKGYSKYKEQDIFQVDVDKAPAWCKLKGVQSLPCVLIFNKKWEVVRRAEGYMTPDQFATLLNKPFNTTSTTTGTQRQEVFIFEGARTILSWIAHAIYKILE